MAQAERMGEKISNSPLADSPPLRRGLRHGIDALRFAAYLYHGVDKSERNRYRGNGRPSRDPFHAQKLHAARIGVPVFTDSPSLALQEERSQKMRILGW